MHIREQGSANQSRNPKQFGKRYTQFVHSSSTTDSPALSMHQVESWLSWLSSGVHPGRSLKERNPKIIQSLMPIWEWFYHHYFQVQTDGWHHIPKTGNMLFVGSHNGGLACPDLPMFTYDWFQRFGYSRVVYGLTHPKVWDAYPLLGDLAAQVGAIQARPQLAIAALRAGASVLVYPGGAQDVFRPHRLRGQIYFHRRQGFIKLALREAVPIVPLISWGAHDTLIVLEDCYEQVRQLHTMGMPWPFNMDPEVLPIYLGLPWGIAIGPLLNIPLPVRIHTRVCEPIWFERYGRDLLGDRDYLDACYTKVVDHMQSALDRLIAECN